MVSVFRLFASPDFYCGISPDLIIYSGAGMKNALRCWTTFSAPTGAQYESPGHRPGNQSIEILSAEGATHLPATVSPLCRPFRARYHLGNKPRAMPGAIVCRPVGAVESLCLLAAPSEECELKAFNENGSGLSIRPRISIGYRLLPQGVGGWGGGVGSSGTSAAGAVECGRRWTIRRGGRGRCGICSGRRC